MQTGNDAAREGKDLKLQVRALRRGPHSSFSTVLQPSSCVSCPALRHVRDGRSRCPLHGRLAALAVSSYLSNIVHVHTLAVTARRDQHGAVLWWQRGGGGEVEMQAGISGTP